MKIIKTEKFDRLNGLMEESYNCMKRFEIEYAVFKENEEDEYIQTIYNKLIQRYERRFRKFQNESLRLA